MATQASPSEGPTAARSPRGDRARRGGRPRRLRHRRAPSPGLFGFGDAPHPRGGGGANQAHPPDERRHRTERNRSGAPLPELRDARSLVARTRRDGGRPWLVHRRVPVVRPQPRGLRRAHCREPGRANLSSTETIVSSSPLPHLGQLGISARPHRCRPHPHNPLHNHLSETGLDGPTLPVTVSPRLYSLHQIYGESRPQTSCQGGCRGFDSRLPLT
jgi:hypothetical protein